MVTVPPRHYCTVANPVSRDAQGSVLLDVTGQVRLRHADLEIRLAQDPFPLYPGEVLEKVSVLPPLHHTLPIVPPCPRAPHYLLRGKKNGTMWEGGVWRQHFLFFARDRIDLLPLHSHSPNALFLLT